MTENQQKTKTTETDFKDKARQKTKKRQRIGEKAICN